MDPQGPTPATPGQRGDFTQPAPSEVAATWADVTQEPVVPATGVPGSVTTVVETDPDPDRQQRDNN